MAGRLIVDGHNLALSGTIPLAAPPSEAEGRRELCEIVSRYARRKGVTVTVVFDGAPAGAAPGGERSRGGGGGGGRVAGGGTPEGEPFKGGRAVYSPPGQTGDDVVRRRAGEAPEGSWVVTDDRGLAASLPRRRVTAVSCAEFASILLADAFAEMKGGAEEEDGEGRRRGTEKKGEGKRAKKGERRHGEALRKLR